MREYYYFSMTLLLRTVRYKNTRHFFFFYSRIISIRFYSSLVLLLLLLFFFFCGGRAFFCVDLFDIKKKGRKKKDTKISTEREYFFVYHNSQRSSPRTRPKKRKSRLGEQESLGSLGWRLWNQRPKHTKGRKESHLKRDLGIYS